MCVISASEPTTPATPATSLTVSVEGVTGVAGVTGSYGRICSMGNSDGQRSGQVEFSTNFGFGAKSYSSDAVNSLDSSA